MKDTHSYRVSVVNNSLTTRQKAELISAEWEVPEQYVWERRCLESGRQQARAKASRRT